MPSAVLQLMAGCRCSLRVAAAGGLAQQRDLRLGSALRTPAASRAVGLGGVGVLNAQAVP